MKITAIETIPVSAPVGRFRDGMDKVAGHDAPARYHKGRVLEIVRPRNADGFMVLSNVIVKIHTDAGITGIGEAACDQTEPVEVVRAMLDRHMAPKLIGEDPLDWRVLIDLMSWESARGAARFSTSGIDLALHDLVGKILRVPVYTLLGGCRREKVLAGIEVPRGTPEHMAEHSYEYYQQGIRGIKAKVGSDPVRDAECILAIRQRLGPDISLRADANCGYTLSEAKTFCKLVEASGAGLELLEQPLETHDLAGFRELRNATALPIEVDESAYSLSMVHLILKHDAADIINTKCAKRAGSRGHPGGPRSPRQRSDRRHRHRVGAGPEGRREAAPVRGAREVPEPRGGVHRDDDPRAAAAGAAAAGRRLSPRPHGAGSWGRTRRRKDRGVQDARILTLWCCDDNSNRKHPTRDSSWS